MVSGDEDGAAASDAADASVDLCGVVAAADRANESSCGARALDELFTGVGGLGAGPDSAHPTIQTLARIKVESDFMTRS